MYNKFLAIIITCIVLASGAKAQDRSPNKKPIAANKDQLDTIDQSSLNADRKSRSTDKPASILNQLEDLLVRMNKFENILDRGFDTTQIDGNLETIEGTIRVIDSNLVAGKNISQINLRNVSSFKVITLQFDRQLKNWNEQFINFTSSVNADYQYIRSTATNLNTFDSEEDSVQKLSFIQQINSIFLYSNQLMSKKDSLFSSLLGIEKRIARAYVKNASLLDELQFRIATYSTAVFKQSHPPLWRDSKNNFATPLTDDFKYTLTRASKVLLYYFKNNGRSIIISLIILIAFYSWIQSNKSYLTRNDRSEMLKPLLYVVNYPLLSSILVLCFINPYIYLSPPAIFVEMMWMIAALITTYFFWEKEKSIIRIIWILILFIGFLMGIDNLLYDYSIGERWAIVLCNLTLIGLCLYVFIKGVKAVNKYNTILRFSLIIVLVGSVLGLLLNLFGYLALAKLVSNSAVKQFILALCLSFITELFTEAIYLQLERMKSMQTGAYLEYETIRSKFKSYLNVGAIVLWFFGFIWSLSFHDIALRFFVDFFDYPISIGSLSFTLNAALVFTVTLWISLLISNLLSVIFGTAEQQFASTKKSKVGSWMMLVRVGVISIGFFIAVGAAGIPIDKLAIVFGALSVGIGFGLQNIVGNLISGVILAFEKPMQVGDVIEIGSNTGTVKQIGIRSSTISTYDGADIIVPNGDFITQKLTNWTHSNTYRRIEIIVGVAYNTDLDKVTDIIDQLILSNAKVMKYPAHNVIVQQFADSSVNFRVLFWTNDFDNWLKLKSDVHKDIYKAFAENDIQIPFPQQVIHIKSIPDLPNTTIS